MILINRSRFHNIFEGNQQQDAHELLVYLLDNIRETCDLLTQQVQNYPDVLCDAEVNILFFFMVGVCRPGRRLY